MVLMIEKYSQSTEEHETLLYTSLFGVTEKKLAKARIFRVRIKKIYRLPKTYQSPHTYRKHD
jgi:hypothetical protein